MDDLLLFDNNLADDQDLRANKDVETDGNDDQLQKLLGLQPAGSKDSDSQGDINLIDSIAMKK